MKKIIIGNLKMKLISVAERDQYLKSLKKELIRKKFAETEIVLCPPVIHLEVFEKFLKNKIYLGGQNCFWEEKGSYTGEIAPSMLVNFGCSYVIIGHSERRRYFGESDQSVNRKVLASLKNGLFPIICVGETKEDRQSGATMQVVTNQVKEAFLGIKAGNIEKIIVAYEPVWSVGTDNIPSSNEIMEAKVLIQKVLTQNYPKKYVEKVRIVYGGSVGIATVGQVCVESGMDGALIGRESLFPRDFLRIAEIIGN